MAWTSDDRLVSGRVTASIWSGKSFVLLDESGIESTIEPPPMEQSTPGSSTKPQRCPSDTHLPSPILSTITYLSP